MTGKDVMPFVRAIENVFSTMVSVQVAIGPPAIRSSDEPETEVSSIISISGDMVGAVVMCFSRETAEALASLFTGQPITIQHADFGDAMGELANMVAGNAKAEFTGQNLSIGCPSVVTGAGHRILQQKDHPILLIPCSCECGDFRVEVSMKQSAVAGAVSVEAA